MKSLSFSNNVQNNLLIKELRYSRKLSDFESTFI